MKLSDAPPPGWYPDPAGGARLRWWEGTDWSDRYRARPFGAQGVGPEQPATGGDRPGMPGWNVPAQHVDTEALIAQVRLAARAEAERAAQLFGQQARAATRNITPLISEYTNKITRWFRILAVIAILLIVGWVMFQLFAQQSLFEWIGDRIDKITDEIDEGSAVGTGVASVDVLLERHDLVLGRDVLGGQLGL